MSIVRSPLAARYLGLAACLCLPGTALAGATASSFQKENKKGANYWNAQSALDGKMETAWRVPGDSKNKGEWIQVDVGMTATVSGLGLVIGWDKDEDTFKDYARVKQARVDVFATNSSFDLELAGSATVDFADQRGMQVVAFDEPIKIEADAGGAVKITVTDVYPGVDFPSMGVSEVVVQLGEIYDPPNGLMVVDGSNADNDAFDLTDGNPRTKWTAPSDGAKLEIEATGFGMSRVGLQRLDTYHDRPKKVKISVGTKEIVVEVADAKEMQWITVPSTFGYSGSTLGKITLEVLEVYPGSRSPGTLALGEVSAKATIYDALTF